MGNLPEIKNLVSCILYLVKPLSWIINQVLYSERYIITFISQ